MFALGEPSMLGLFVTCSSVSITWCVSFDLMVEINDLSFLDARGRRMRDKRKIVQEEG